jgi:hypothetical protein
VSIKKKFFFHKRKALSGIPTRVQIGGIIYIELYFVISTAQQIINTATIKKTKEKMT